VPVKQQVYISPFNFFFIIFPSGISQGFATVVMPFLLIQHGFSVSSVGTIVATAVSANLFRFIWGPVVDLSLSLKKWYWISLLGIVLCFLSLAIVNINIKNELLLSGILFLSQVAATFMVLPITSFIAISVKQERKGAAAGWYQAGSLAGTGLAGGAGIWLCNHYDQQTCVYTLVGLSILFAMPVLRLKDVFHNSKGDFLHAVGGLGKDLWSLIKIPVGLITLILVCLPIGSGAAANLWSGIATEWQTSADTVALVTGILSAVVSTIGCVIGGYIVDKAGGWRSYMISGAVCAIVALVMSVTPFVSAIFIPGVLLYTFGIGMINAAFSSVILFAVGKKNTATKYALLASFGNLPVVYMTAWNGWIHDQFNSRIMLLVEGAVGICFVLMFMIILKRMNKQQLLSPVADQ